MSDAAPGHGPARHAVSARGVWTALESFLARYGAGAVGVLVAAIALATINRAPLGVFWDDGVYLISAKALATGAGYRLIHLPGAPADVHFPPAWPALLSLVWRATPAFPDSVPWFKLVNPLLLGAGASLGCTFGIRRLSLAPGVAAFVTLVCAAALPLLVVTGVLFSEPLFLAVLFLALLAAEQAAERGGWRSALAAGLAAGALMLVRTAGIAIIPALFGAMLLARTARWREAAVAAGGLLAVIVPWQLWVATHAPRLAAPLRGAYGPYLDWVLDLYRERGASHALLIARENVLALFRTAGIAVFPFGPRPIRPLLVTILLVLAAYGLLFTWKRSRATVLFVLCYAFVVLVWPYAPDRFLWAVWPLTGLVAAAGAGAAWHAAQNTRTHPQVRAASALVVLVAAFALADHAAYSLRGVSRGWHGSAARSNAAALDPVVAWIRANTLPTDVVACDGEPLVHLYSGRTVVPVHILSADEYLAGTPLETAADGMRALFLAHRPRYVVFSAAAAELAAAPLLDGANGTPRLEPLGALPGGGAAFRVHVP